MSFSTILSAVIEGLEVAFIHVEADISNGLPVFHMVGGHTEVKEAEKGENWIKKLIEIQERDCCNLSCCNASATARLSAVAAAPMRCRLRETD